MPRAHVNKRSYINTALSLNESIRKDINNTSVATLRSFYFEEKQYGREGGRLAAGIKKKVKRYFLFCSGCHYSGSAGVENHKIKQLPPT